MKKFRLVGVGGTFDELHKGHLALLNKAFEVGESVWIGLVTDDFAKRLLKNHEIAPYSERLEELTRYLEGMGFGGRFKVTPIDDPYGPAAISGELEAIVVSQETEPMAHRINEARKSYGLAPLEVVVINMVPAENHIPISSTRIRLGEIDREGRLLRPRGSANL
ncbi:MAG: phosphopantetheine adenylyltransferase [Nitrososphaerota archaeon]|nr:phosphopantetheine adenylyltransferase [Candidatus Bathyarchaeota archaeon]MDW8049058.1 phosphopantetheine adenylyltransferase [Nitrososphaerota archaeon]